MPIEEFYKKRHKIVIYRALGGAGDILMHRMMFEDFKLLLPEVDITFAIPPQFMPLVENHPFIDSVIDFRTCKAEDYMLFYNTTSSCLIYEQKMRCFGVPHKNRPDIWANSCGVNLTKHNMHMKLSEEIISKGKDMIRAINPGNKPAALLSPIAMSSERSLDFWQYELMVKKLKEMGCMVYGVHMNPDPLFKKLGIIQFYGNNIKDWMSTVSAADYVVSVDTGTFHLAGGLGKPMIGLFTYIDGKIRGCHYDFVLVQKHKDNGDWECGPCWRYEKCPRTQDRIKPCASEISKEMLLNAIDKMFEKWPKQH